MRTALPPQAFPENIVTVLTPSDVLFGRGSGPNDHEGNIRFRDLVQERKEEYLSTNHRQTKARIAREVVNAVFEKNGRFLRRLETQEAKRYGLPEGMDAWIVVDDDKDVMEKAKQALRQNRTRSRQDSDQSPVRSPAPAPVSAPKSPKHEPVVQPQPIAQSQPAIVTGSQQALTFSGLSNLSGLSNMSSLEPLPYAPETEVSGVLGPIPTTLNRVSSGQHQPPPAATPEPVPLMRWSSAPNDSGGMGLRPQIPQSSMPPPDNMPAPRPRPSMSRQNAMQLSQSLQPERQEGGGIEGSAVNRMDSNRASFMERADSIQIHDLVSSFSTMATKEDGEQTRYPNQFEASTETMGTIEPIQDASGMSFASFSSSTFSVMKSALADDKDDEAETVRDSHGDRVTELNPGRINRRASYDYRLHGLVGRDDSTARRGSGIMDASMTFSDIFNSRRGSSLQLNPGSSRVIMEGVESDDYDANGNRQGDPRPVEVLTYQPDSMDGLGHSSLSVIRAAVRSGDTQGWNEQEQAVGDRHGHMNGNTGV